MKLILGLIMCVIISGCQFLSTESGGYLDSNTKLLKAKSGRIESAGADLRVYEFTPLSDSTKTCIFVAGGRKGGLVCFDKP